MVLTREFEIKAALVLGLALLSLRAEGASKFGTRRGLADADPTVFDVTTYGAKPNGRTESAQAFIRAWKDACKSSGPAKLLIPEGSFMTGEVVFQGPCTAPKPLTIEIQGTILAQSDLSSFTSSIWISLEDVDGVEIIGKGTINGQGEAVYKYGNCNGHECPNLLPVSFVFDKCTNSAMRDISFVNSMGFHMKVFDSTDITIENLHITAPGGSPNTDGIHLSGSKNVVINNSIIGTGDDCISVGEGNTNVTISGITCGPGHGISIGSLGKRPDDQDLKGVTVTNCTLTGTTNGARIKSYHDSPHIVATGIIFDDIVMNDVKNPIIIDQHYAARWKRGQSNVKISDVHFRNIRGTTISKFAVSLMCSSAFPCEGVELADIDLALSTTAPRVDSTAAKTGIASHCENVKTTYSGKQNPAACA